MRTTWPSPTESKVLVAETAGPFDELPTFEDLVSLVTQAPAPKRLAKLKQLKIVLFSEPDAADYSAASSAIPAIKWVAFETDIDKRRYFLHNGSWYLLAPPGPCRPQWVCALAIVLADRRHGHRLRLASAS